MISFNVLTEPWISAVWRDGKIAEGGILEVLEHAHELSAITDPAPPVEFGVYRLLTAFVLDAFCIREIEDIDRVLSAGRFEPPVLQRYVDSIGSKRFDLFDSEHPFLQSSPEQGEKENTSPVVKLFQHLPSGSFATHFHHVTEKAHALSPALCARGLTTIAPFMTAGGAGYSPSVNGMPPWYVLIQGANLFETLVLNCYALPSYELAGDEPSAWASDRKIAPREDRKCASLLEGLTWRPRTVRLIPGDGGTCTYTGRESDVLVRNMVFTFGFRASGGWTDPQVAYKFIETGPAPLRPKEDRELWRDTGPLTLLRKDEWVGENGRIRFERPLVVEQFLILQRKMIIPREKPLVLEVYGMRTDNMKIFEWFHDVLSLKDGILHNNYAGKLVQDALDLAEKVDHYLGKALRKAYPREGEGNEKALNALIRSARLGFWASLQPQFKGQFLEELSELEPEDLERRKLLTDAWKTHLREIARAAFESAIEPLDGDAAALHRQVEARDYFYLVTAFAPPREDKPKRREQAS